MITRLYRGNVRIAISPVLVDETTKISNVAWVPSEEEEDELFKILEVSEIDGAGARYVIVLNYDSIDQMKRMLPINEGQIDRIVHKYHK